MARALPPKTPPAPDAQPPRRYTRIVDTPRVPSTTPAAQALERLAADVVAAGNEGVRLAAWRERDEAARAMAPHVWLVFAVMALRGRRMRVELLRKGARAGEHFAHNFDDALAWAAPQGRPWRRRRIHCRRQRKRRSRDCGFGCRLAGPGPLIGRVWRWLC